MDIAATARELIVHQMSGILPEVTRSTCPVADSLRLETALAISYKGSNHQLDENIAMRDTRTRVSKPLDDILVQSSP